MSEVVLLVVLGVYATITSDKYRLRSLRSNPLAIIGVGIAGFLGVLWSAVMAKGLIDSYVWEGSSLLVNWLFVYGLAYLGLFLLLRAFHAHELTATGSSLALTLEQEDELFYLLENEGKSGLRKRFALAKTRYVNWTGTDPFDANRVL